MSRKEALSKLRDVLLLRREALRKALDGDLSMLQSLSQDGGDVIDAAMDTAQYPEVRRGPSHGHHRC